MFCFLKKVEACSEDEDGKVCGKNWVEDGSEFRLGA